MINLIQTILNFLKSVRILNNSLLNYILVIFIIAIGVFLIQLIKYFVINHLKKLAQKTSTGLDDFIIRLIHLVVIPFLHYLLVYFVTLSILQIHPIVKKIMYVIWIFSVVFYIIQLIMEIIHYSIENTILKNEGNESLVKSFEGINLIIKGILWLVGLIFITENLGLKVTTALAGLGITGLALALALQHILVDLLSYFSILLDKPFIVGDFIEVGELTGTVEHIGIKTTRVRSLRGEEIIFSNQKLTSNTIKNYKRMKKRRVVFNTGIDYNTPIDKLKKIPNIIKNIVTTINDVEFERTNLVSFEDYNILFETVYYINDRDFSKFRHVQEQINLKLKQKFDEEKIEFAFPTQTIYLKK